MSEEVKKAVCVWCKGECGVLVHVKDGRLIKAVEDPDWPRKVYPRTRACPRLKAAKEWFYHPERVNFPLKRAAERGENKWQRMSWTEAFDEIAERIQKIKDAFGGEAIVHTQGTSYREEYPLRARFFSQLGGSPTYAGASNICFMPRSTMANAIVGMFSHYSVGPKSKCIVLLGAEPLNARPINAQVIRDAKKRGTKLIVIDPRFTRSASLADTWLQLRPGTDCALLLGMIYVIIEEGLYDKDFVEKWCHGFDQLRKHVKRYTPEEVEKITLVSSEKLREAARIYAGNRPGAILEGVATEQSQNAGEILQARWILAGLTGNIDVEGGEELTGPHPTIISCREVEPGIRFSPEQQGKQIASDRFRLLSWQGQRIITENMKKVWGKTTGVPSVSHGPSMYRTILTGKPYPIRGVITMASNPMVTQPDTKLIYKALKSLDLYVVKDFWMTPSAQLADYVLPSSSWLERPILWDFCGYDRYMVSGEAAVPQTVPGEYEHKTDFDFWRELGLRLGQGDYWPWKDLEEYYDARLAPTGLKHKEYVYTVRCEHKKPGYKKYERTGFATPTGKVELYSTVLEKLDYPPLPSFKEPTESKVSNPDLAREYPLTLITGGRTREFYHSEWRQIDSVRSRHPDPLLQIHPETAAALDISEGDWVWIETRRGRVRQKATLFDGMDPSIVHAEHGWWLPELPGEEPWLHGVWEVNINVVIDDNPDICNSITGAWPLKTALCKVYKVKKY